MNFLYGLLVSGLVGSMIFVVLLAIRPVTMKLFSKTWHYYSLLVPMSFLLGGTIVAAGVIYRARNIDFTAEHAGAQVNMPMDLALPPLPNDMELPINFATPPLPITVPQLTQPSIGIAQPYGINDLPANMLHEPTPSQFVQAATGFSDGLANFAREGYRVMLAIWGLGVLLFIGISKARYVSFRKQVLLGSEKYTDVYCPIPVVMSSFAQTPMLLGVLKPLVVLPKIAYTKEELEIVLTHEMVHYRRKDLAYKLLAFFTQAIHWYNPLGILLMQQLNNFCELSVDEQMATEMDNMGRKFYGETILQVLQKSTAKRSSVLMPATNLSCSKNELKRRLINMKNAKKMKKTACVFAMLVTVAIIGGGLFASYLFDAAMPEDNLTGVVTVSPESEAINVPPITQPLSPQPQDETENRRWADLRSNFESAAARLSAEYSHDLNISVLVIDTENNGVVLSVGDIDKRNSAYHIFWPITTAIFADALGISVHDEFPNDLYYLPGDLIWRSAQAWHLLFEDINYHEGYSTLMQSFRNGDPNVFFNASAMHDRDLLFELFSELGLDHVEPNDDISSIFGRFELSSVEIGLLYSMLINGGNLYPALGIDSGRQVFSENAINQAMEVLDSHLAEMDEFWGVFGQIRGSAHFEEFAGSVIGKTNDFMTIGGPHGDVAGSWFVGLYPAEAPRFVTVISLSYDLHYQNQRWERGITRSSMTDLAAIMYEMFFAPVAQHQSVSEPISTNVTSEDFGFTTDFVWMNNLQLIVCNERNISFHMRPIYFLSQNRTTEFSYLGIDVNDVATFPVYARIPFAEAAKIAASAIYDKFGICVGGLVGYMHLAANNPSFRNAWIGLFMHEELTRHSDGYELFYFRVDLVTGEVISLVMNTPETPFLG